METKISRSLLTSIFLGKFWNSLTFPWLFSFFLNFPDWKCNSLTFPWPGNFFIFQNFFPDRGNPVLWGLSWCAYLLRSYKVVFLKVCGNGPKGPKNSGGVHWYFHTYVGSVHFFGVKFLNFNIFLGFQKNEYFFGHEHFMDIFLGHPKIGLVLEVISMYFRVFS